MLSNFTRDFLYAFRVFGNKPGLTLLAVLALSISMGMAIGTFSVLNGIFVKPLPYKNGEQLRYFQLEKNEAEGHTSSEKPYIPITFEQYQNINNLDGIQGAMAYYMGTANVSGQGDPQRYDGAYISRNFLNVLGLKPLHGKGFSLEPSPGQLEVMISYEIWEESFRQDKNTIGTELRVNGIEMTVVGILDKGFKHPQSQDIWIPLDDPNLDYPQNQEMSVVTIVRLDPKFTSDNSIAKHLESQLHEKQPEKADFKVTLMAMREPYVQNSRSTYVLLSVVAIILILIVACANVANLLIGRSLSRGREIAIRSALGASRKRILSQLLTESFVLSLFGAVGGLLYAAWTVDITLNSDIFKIPYWMNFDLDWRSFIFTAFIALCTTISAGIIPAWQSSKINLNESLKDASYSTTNFRLGRSTRMLAIAQIALAFALLFGAGLIMRHIHKIANAPLGFDPSPVLTMRMGLFEGDYPSETERDAFYKTLTLKVARLPGIKSAAVSSWIGQFGNYQAPFFFSEDLKDVPTLEYVYHESISREYFSTLQLNILKGRGFLSDDTSKSTNVVIVNQAFADKYSNGNYDNLLGKTMQLIMGAEVDPNDPSKRSRIIGVVENAKTSNFLDHSKFDPIIYSPFTQTPSQFMTLLTRTQDGKVITHFEEQIKQQILQIDPHLPVYFTQTMEDVVNAQLLLYRILAHSFITIGLMALFLASVGVYGMIAFNVNRRSRELGIRMALGATRKMIASHVVSQGFIQVSVGITTGAILAYGIGVMVRNFIYEVNPLDVTLYASVILVLVSIASIAFAIPARKAAKLSPMEAMRYE